MKAGGDQIPQRKPSPLGLFWPNAIAECDTSFLEGSDIYTPSKLPYFKTPVGNLNNSDLVHIPNMSSNYGSLSKRNHNNNANINSCSRGLVMNGGGGDDNNSRSGSPSPNIMVTQTPPQQQYHHQPLPSYLSSNNVVQSPVVMGFQSIPGPTIVPVYNHTGSPDSSDLANE
jgi:hypothetical protein